MTDEKPEQTTPDIVREIVRQDRLSISRVPVQTKKDFIELAKEEFCDDYGQALKYLMDQARINIKYEDLLSRVVIIEAIMYEERMPETPAKKSIKLLDGRVIEKKEVEK